MRLFRASLLGVLLVTGVLVPSARADDEPDEEPPATTTTLPGAVAIGDGYSFTGAVITGPEGTEPRTLDGYQAATFVQAWLAEAFFGTPNMQDPPPEAPVHRVDVTGTWGVLTGTMTVYYASDGTTPWLSFPQDQVPTPTAATSPPPPTNWFVAPARTVEAFNGTATLEPTAGAATTTTTSVPPADTGAPASASDDADSSSTTAWGLGAAALAVLGAGVALLRRRRS